MRQLTENPFIRQEASSRDLVSRLLGAADDKPAPLAAMPPLEHAVNKPEPPFTPATETPPKLYSEIPGPAFDFPEGWWQRFLETQKRMVREFFGGSTGI